MASRIDNIAPPGSLFKLGKSKRRAPARPTAPGQRRPSVKDPKHLAAIRQCPCAIRGCGKQAEPAHLRVSSMQHDKPFTGIGQKPCDRWVIPLCPEHHRTGAEAQHRYNELSWWTGHGIDPFVLAIALHEASPDVDAMTVIIRKGAWK